MSNKETGLMKKTKAQLVEIILRKDDEEILLKNGIKRLTDSLNDAETNVQQHQSGMDELTSQKVAAENAAKKFEKERNSARSWNFVLATIVVIITLWSLL